MKSKRHKQIRNTFQNFFLNFQFEEPVQILLDGNFVKSAIDIQFDLDKISQILQKNVKFFASQCLQNELNNLGQSVHYIQDSLQKYGQLKCDHDQCSVKDCFIKTVGFKNKNKFCIATQDQTLIQWFQQNSIGVPIFIFVNKNILSLKEMNKISQQKIQKKMSQKFLNKNEQKNIYKQKKELHNQQSMKRKKQIYKQRQRLGIKVKKKARGPNPLSLKRRNNQ